MTPDGPRAVADLQAGDAVRTLDHGAARLIWTGQQRVQGTGPNAPVRFATGAIGNHAPLLLSQQHRVLMRTPLAELLFGHPEVLIPARALVDGGDVRLTPAAHITYVHILLARHEVLWAEGAECESLLLGEETQRVLDDPARDEMHRLMPGASRPPSGAVHSRAARPILRMGEARRLIAARARASPATRHLVRAGS